MKKEYYNIRPGKVVAYAEWNGGNVKVVQTTFRLGERRKYGCINPG